MRTISVQLFSIIIKKGICTDLISSLIRSDGKRNAAAIAFREAFGKLSTLRLFCKQGKL